MMLSFADLRSRLSTNQPSPLAQKIRSENLTYLSPEKLLRIEQAIRRTKKVKGDILEFGVALGGSGILLAKAAKGRRFIGFDVFGMIPEPTSEKDDAKSKTRYETIRSGQSKGLGGQQYYGYRDDLLGEVRASFARHNVPVNGDSIQLVKGLFRETWPTAGVKKIALAHIDCDWYDPVKFCLIRCAGWLQVGGILVIDDYNDYGGCRTAVDEFLATHPEYDFEEGVNPFLTRIY